MAQEGDPLEEFIKIILTSGRSALDLALYILLPVMVVMMAFMTLIEERGLLARVARLLAPVMRVFGVPGAGVFALLQLMLVSFAAPLATLSIMERDGTARRAIAATLAMVFTLSQANVVFPMVAVGLDLRAVVFSSLVGGLLAAALTYHVFARSVHDRDEPGQTSLPAPKERRKTTALNLLILGGQEAVKIVIASIPILILAIFLVNVLKTTGAIALAQQLLSPFLGLLGLPGTAVLPIVTKFMAGGTAMMGVTLNMLKEGTFTVMDLNRIAGFIINPFDLVGVAVLISAGARCASVVRPAAAGAMVGILVRGVLHLLMF